MQVETVTTLDRSLLHHVRQTLGEAESALLCVAFVQERGVHLLEREMEALRRRQAGLRLLVTTTFAATDDSALGFAWRLGAKVRVLNPGGSSFHPKVFLGSGADGLQAVVGSANLTGGLATNVEAGVWMKGSPDERPLARLRDFAEQLWGDPRAEDWQPGRAAESHNEVFLPDLRKALFAEVKANPVFRTLGGSPRPNHVVEACGDCLIVETERSLRETGGGQPIPAWMFNLAWDHLRTHGELTNTVLLEDLRVHRSSAVCAILARLPGVERVPGRQIALRWRKG